MFYLVTLPLIYHLVLVYRRLIFAQKTRKLEGIST